MTTEYEKRKTGYTPVLSPSEQHIFRFIMHHTDQIRGMPIRQLADLSNTSTTTIMRMAKKFGYPGYSVFRDELSRVSEDGNGLRGISRYDLDYFFADTVRSSDFTDALSRAADILERCDTVLFSGDHEGKKLIDLACRMFAETGRNTGKISSFTDGMNPQRTCAVFILGCCRDSSPDGLYTALNSRRIQTIVISAAGSCMVKDCSQMISCGLPWGNEEELCGSVLPVVYILEELRKKLSSGR